MRTIINILFIAIATIFAGCHELHPAGSPSVFYVMVLNHEGENLLDENTPDNILNEKTQFILDGKEYKISWQFPYLNYQGPYRVSLRDDGFGKCMSANNFSWFYDLFPDNPVIFNLELGDNEFEFTLFASSGDKHNFIILPDGTRQEFNPLGFIIVITYREDGVPTVKIWDGNYQPETT